MGLFVGQLKADVSGNLGVSEGKVVFHFCMQNHVAFGVEDIHRAGQMRTAGEDNFVGELQLVWGDVDIFDDGLGGCDSIDRLIVGAGCGVEQA